MRTPRPLSPSSSWAMPKEGPRPCLHSHFWQTSKAGCWTGNQKVIQQKEGLMEMYTVMGILPQPKRLFLGASFSID